MAIIKVLEGERILYQHNKKTGTTYVYSAKSYWDKEKKLPGASRLIWESWILIQAH
jgi:hypothetical protein